MKRKITTFICALFLGSASYAQYFFEETTYRGAFGAANSVDWASGWANFNPETTVYPAANKTVDADIIVDTKWSAGDVILLKNKVYVTNNATLTIEPGVVIRGDKSTEGTLIISKGSKIKASGTANNPIVFTSNFDVDQRNPGDWGGIILLGKAVNNFANGNGVIEGGLDSTKAAHGGTDDLDNSGNLQFVRIEFAGYPFAPDKEINGLTLGSVGSGTTIDHVQVSFSNDDSFEWFGGSVNAKYLIAYRGIDDDFDTDNGFRGKVQFGLIVRDPELADQCNCSTSESFESDNDGAGSDNSPKTAAVFSNITAVGPYRGSLSNTIDAKFRRALRIRRNSSISVLNSVFTDWPTGLHIEGVKAEANAQTANGLVFSNNTFAGMKANFKIDTTVFMDVRKYFFDNHNDTIVSASGLFVNAYPTLDLAPDYRLAAGSALLSGADFSNSTKLGQVIHVGIKKENNDLSINLFPNPVKENAVINFSLAQASKMRINIYDITGSLVRTVLNESVSAGAHTYNVNTQNLNSGVYFINMESDSISKTMKFLISK